jgi:hypothetical protein
MVLALEHKCGSAKSRDESDDASLSPVELPSITSSSRGEMVPYWQGSGNGQQAVLG